MQSVFVGPWHIHRGERGDPCRCPVALAIADVCPTPMGLLRWVVSTHYQECDMWGGVNHSLKTSGPFDEQTSIRISCFDDTGHMDPFSFVLPEIDRG